MQSRAVQCPALAQLPVQPTVVARDNSHPRNLNNGTSGRRSPGFALGGIGGPHRSRGLRSRWLSPPIPWGPGPIRVKKDTSIFCSDATIETIESAIEEANQQLIDLFADNQPPPRAKDVSQLRRKIYNLEKKKEELGLGQTSSHSATMDVNLSKDPEATSPSLLEKLEKARAQNEALRREIASHLEPSEAPSAAADVAPAPSANGTAPAPPEVEAPEPPTLEVEPPVEEAPATVESPPEPTTGEKLAAKKEALEAQRALMAALLKEQEELRQKMESGDLPGVEPAETPEPVAEAPEPEDEIPEPEAEEAPVAVSVEVEGDSVNVEMSPEEGAGAKAVESKASVVQELVFEAGKPLSSSADTAEEAPEPVEEAPQPVAEAPAVVEPEPEKEEAPEPVAEAPAAVEEVTEPVEEAPEPVAEVAAVVEEVTEPLEEAPEPVAEAPAAVEEVTEPVEEAPEPVEEALEPVAEAPAVVEEVTEPVEEAPAAVEETPVFLSKSIPRPPPRRIMFEPEEEVQPVAETSAVVEEAEAPTEPVAEMPAPVEEEVPVAEAPVVEEVVPEPVEETPEPVAEAPVVEEAVPEPVAEAPVVEEVIPEPVAEAPVVEEDVPQPVAEAPVVEEAVPEPVAEEAVPEPVVEEAVPEPVAEEAVPEPVVEEAVPEPVAEEAVPEPVVEEAVPEPVAEEAVPEPVVEEAVPEPVAEGAVPEPVAEAPVVEEAVPEPVVEIIPPTEKVPEPVAEAPVVAEEVPAPQPKANPRVQKMMEELEKLKEERRRMEEEMEAVGPAPAAASAPPPAQATEEVPLPTAAAEVEAPAPPAPVEEEQLAAEEEEESAAVEEAAVPVAAAVQPAKEEVDIDAMVAEQKAALLAQWEKEERVRAEEQIMGSKQALYDAIQAGEGGQRQQVSGGMLLENHVFVLRDAGASGAADAMGLEGAGARVQVFYNAGAQSCLQGASAGGVSTHIGINNWYSSNGAAPTFICEMEHLEEGSPGLQLVPASKELDAGAWWAAEVELPDNVCSLEMVFSAGNGAEWDNNNKQDYRVRMAGAMAVAEAALAAMLEDRYAALLEERIKTEGDALEVTIRRGFEREQRKEEAWAVLKRQQSHVLYTEPEVPVAGQPVTIFYNPSNTCLAGSQNVYFVGGWNRWNHADSTGYVKMDTVSAAKVSVTVDVPSDAFILDFVFTNEASPGNGGAYDNRNNLDYHVPVTGAVEKDDSGALVPVQEKPMHVVHISVEMAPVAKVGGLGDVVTSLGRAVQDEGHRVEVILPKYDCAKWGTVSELHHVMNYTWGGCTNQVWKGQVENLDVYFIEPENGYFSAGCIYGTDYMHIPLTDPERFGFFSRTALEFLLQSGRNPDIIHCHDWQTAPCAESFWNDYQPFGLDNPRIVFTIHNLNYGVPLVASAMQHCNKATTVSPTYATEVSHMDAISPHQDKFYGIRNGIDPDIWDPAIDPLLPMNFGPANVDEGKQRCKQELRSRGNLGPSDAPMVGVVTRLTQQKGIHLIKHAIYVALSRGCQVCLLGSAPDPKVQEEFEAMAEELRSQYWQDCRLFLYYDEELSHLIYAGSDMLLVPSMFEPCGLSQLIAMKYGAVPIVRRTGGLADTVFDVHHDQARAEWEGLDCNGFQFDGTDTEGIDYALHRAIDMYYDRKSEFQALQRTCADQDWSWSRPAIDYIELYHAARK